jgi:hypothetical protein
VQERLAFLGAERERDPHRDLVSRLTRRLRGG